MKVSISKGPKFVIDPYDGTTGLYMACTFLKQSIKHILKISDMLGIPAPNEEKLHTTVLYSPEGRPDVDKLDSLIARHGTRFYAEIAKVSVHRGHDNKYYVVINLDTTSANGQELLELHEDLKLIGGKHSYPMFNPHITLYSSEDDIMQDKSFVKNLQRTNDHVKNQRIYPLIMNLEVPAKLIGD